MEKPAGFCSWGTWPEKKFLEKLGTHCLTRGGAVKSCAPTDYLRRLKKYRETMKGRVRWGMIDKEEVEKFLDKRIENYARACRVQRIG